MSAATLSPRHGAVSSSVRHDSALKHTTGEAIYLDDQAGPPGMLHAALVTSPVAHGRLKGIDAAAALAMPGVVAMITAADIPGVNDVAPVGKDEPALATDKVEYLGHPVAIVVAATRDRAVHAAEAVRLNIEELPPVLTIEAALANESVVWPVMEMKRGDWAAAIAGAPQRLTGQVKVGGQEHFYLEGQIALAIPGEDGDMRLVASTQHPTEVQHIVSRLLGLPYNAVTTEVRRLGGGFGGKESQASLVAGLAALAARKTAKPVKLRLDRATDMRVTGKRHDFLARYEVGFDDEGRIRGLDILLASRAGWSADHSPPVMTRALCHIDNAYYLPATRARGFCCKTNTQSNTAFRGFGGPQGAAAIEAVVEHIARHLGRDPLAVRQLNYYGDGGRDVTPYGQRVFDNLLPRVTQEMLASSDWTARRAAIDAFNASSPVVKRGLGFMPLKFGVSFNLPTLNQGGALVHIYADGSIRLNHGGTEMGQGLHTKVAQVVADVFKVDLDRIKITATTTAEVPNTSATAASTGSDLNGMAAFAAANTIKERLIGFAAAHFGAALDQVVFQDNQVRAGNHVLDFGELAHLAWFHRISLSATGFYRTPDISWDPQSMTGEPFYYFSYGAAVAEVAIDTLTGEHKVLRADLLQDCGRSLNPAIDLGQIEGAFVQGMGWVTCEELWWDAQGRLRTDGPSTYKIPGSRDVPPIFNVRILENSPNPRPTIYRSKAIGEPPLLLAIAVWSALRDAVASLGDHRVPVSLDAPATPERVLFACEDMKRRAALR
ncbi:xanthine dehydrogenase molybdopterin binding subunit [Desertibaculum subflavum]|uniref:xanthine dehydrogenase molybdopterin binding subunit n=1 Tax=Desertibaculum subflavum TaxID=2268458 RepID=UPI000E673672